MSDVEEAKDTPKAAVTPLKSTRILPQFSDKPPPLESVDASPDAVHGLNPWTEVSRSRRMRNELAADAKYNNDMHNAKLKSLKSFKSPSPGFTLDTQPSPSTTSVVVNDDNDSDFDVAEDPDDDRDDTPLIEEEALVAIEEAYSTADDPYSGRAMIASLYPSVEEESYSEA